MFGLATELITKGKLATVKRFDNKVFNLVITRTRRKRVQCQCSLSEVFNDDY